MKSCVKQDFPFSFYEEAGCVPASFTARIYAALIWKAG